MKTVGTKLVVVALSMAILDYIWLAKVAKDFYLRELGDLAIIENGSFKPVLWAAVLVYVCLTIGISFLCLPLAKSTWNAVLLGALLGLSVYGTYDMTNMALIKGWSLKMSIVDICWGIFLCATVSGVSYTILEKLGAVEV